jgi:hypothetical protein
LTQAQPRGETVKPLALAEVPGSFENRSIPGTRNDDIGRHGWKTVTDVPRNLLKSDTRLLGGFWLCSEATFHHTRHSIFCANPRRCGSYRLSSVSSTSRWDLRVWKQHKKDVAGTLSPKTFGNDGSNNENMMEITGWNYEI